MQQLVGLEGSQEFKKLDVAVLSVTTNAVPQLAQAAADWKIQSPLLSDQGAKVSQAYAVMQWAVANLPGHTFVLVGKDGKVKWIRDYGAPEHGGLMNVPVAQLYPEVKGHLSAQ